MNIGEYKKMYEVEDSHFWFVGKRLFVERFLEKFIQKKKLNILDIGSGTGGMTKWLENYGNVVGLEKSKHAVKYAKKRGLRIVQGDANKLSFEDESFDLVTIFDVLYHKNIESDINVLREVRRVLKPNGLLMITDSALSWLWSEHDIKMHARDRYSLVGMEEKANSVGYKTLKKSYLFFSLFPIFLVRKFIKFRGSDVVGVGGFLNTTLLGLLRLEAIGLKYVSYPIGSSVGLLLRKT